MLDANERKFKEMLTDKLDWLAYGGDEALYPLLKTFLGLIPEDGAYDYNALMEGVGAAPAWMIIYSFIACGWIEYGTSPRFGWLEGDGKWIREFCASRTAEKLAEIHQADDEET